MEEVGRRFSWASLPLIATVSRLLHRDLVLQVEYLRVQCDVVTIATSPSVPTSMRCFGARAWSP